MQSMVQRVLRVLPTALVAMGCGGLWVTGCGGDAGGIEGEAPCEDAQCVLPPAPVCNGDVLLSYEPTGTCDAAGQCVYQTIASDCAAQGGQCLRGSCSGTGEPCGGEVCDAPPEATCDGDVAVTYPALGLCERNACAYPPVLTDCTETGEMCLNGACVEQMGACAGVTCDAPPADFCDTSGNRITWRTPGTCEPATGQCAYAQVTEVCGEGTSCVRGACLSPDGLCEGVVCEEPPAPVCNGEALRSVFASTGTCDPESGDCDYAITDEPCGEGEVCLGGNCIADEGPCGGICNDPAPPRCDGNDALTQEALGVCNETSGVCEYTTLREPCVGGQVCLNGLCVDPADPCERVVCSSPPAATCADPGRRLVYSSPGTCNPSTLACNYPASFDVCAEGTACVSGACVDRCASVTCPTRAAFCDANTVVSYTGAGVCTPATGTCDYSATEVRTPCAVTDVCETGVCVRRVQPLELVITEIMAAPTSGSDNEWFEVRNQTVDTLPLGGMLVRDLGRDSWTIPAGTTIGPGETLVFAKVAGAIPSPDLVYGSGFNLSNTDDQIQLYRDSILIDEVRYSRTAAGGWPRTDGRSMALSADLNSAVSNDLSTSWCEASELYDGAQFGTPGEANPVCNFACIGVVCQQERSRCDGNEAVSYTGPGVCTAGGICDSTGVEIRETCAETETCFDGACVPGGFTIAAGDLVITEYMSNPTGVDTGKEWFEIFNTTAAPLPLTGLLVQDADGAATATGDSFIVSGDLVIPAGGYVVFEQAPGASGTPGVPTWDWGGTAPMELTNTADEIILTWRGIEIDRLAWTNTGTVWPATEGRAVQFSGNPRTDDNAARANWCNATAAPYDGTNRGTPGRANTSCEVAPDLTVYRAGSLIITEVMRDPTARPDSTGEWFEVYNASDLSLNLNGLRIEDDGTNAFTIGTSIVLAPGEYAVLANNAAALGTLDTPDFVFTGSAMSLGNSADELVILAGTLEVDRINWAGGWPGIAGESMSLAPSAGFTATGNDVSSAWCSSGTASPNFDTGDNGSPGQANPTEGTCRR